MQAVYLREWNEKEGKAGQEADEAEQEERKARERAEGRGHRPDRGPSVVRGGLQRLIMHVHVYVYMRA